MVSFVYPSCIETPRAESPVNTGRSDYRNPAPLPRIPSSPQHPTATNQLHIREKLTSSMSLILQGCVGGVMCCVALLCFKVGIGVLWLCRTAWDRGSADAPPIPRSSIPSSLCNQRCYLSRVPLPSCVTTSYTFPAAESFRILSVILLGN